MGPRLLEDAHLLIDRGWSVIRTTPGHPDRQGDDTLFEPRESICVTAEWLTRLRESVGAAPVIGIDYTWRPRENGKGIAQKPNTWPPG